MARAEPVVIVDVPGEDGYDWKEARIGERVVLRFRLPPGTTAADLVAFGDHLLKLAREREHGPS
jgi:hypothetical protein